MFAGWREGTDDDLQQFAAANGPAWAQGIEVLDAAHMLADTPAEGHTPAGSQIHAPKDAT
jgi:hypothetical protein